MSINAAGAAGTIYYVISKEPCIISVPFGSHYPFLNLLSTKRPTYFLFWLWSSTESTNELAVIKNEYIKVNKTTPHKEYIFLCNSVAQYDLFGAFRDTQDSL